MLRNLRIFKRKENLVEKLEFSIGGIIDRFIENEMCTDEKAKQTLFYTYTCLYLYSR